LGLEREMVAYFWFGKSGQLKLEHERGKWESASLFSLGPMREPSSAKWGVVQSVVWAVFKIKGKKDDRAEW
jgi:hypothetical protein